MANCDVSDDSMMTVHSSNQHHSVSLFPNKQCTLSLFSLTHSPLLGRWVVSRCSSSLSSPPPARTPRRSPLSASACSSAGPFCVSLPPLSYRISVTAFTRRTDPVSVIGYASQHVLPLPVPHVASRVRSAFLDASAVRGDGETATEGDRSGSATTSTTSLPPSVMTSGLEDVSREEC